MTAPLTHRRLGVALAMGLAALVADAGTAFAQKSRPMKPETKAALDRGIAAYERGDLDAASTALREGIAIEPHPDLYYLLGQSERRAGRCKEATSAYQTFLATQPPESEADLARRNIERCVDAAPPNEAPPSEAPPARLPARDEAPPPPPEEDRTVLWVLAIAGGGALAVYGGIALGVGESVANDSATAGSLEDLRDARTEVRAWRISGGISAAVGVAAIAGGISALLSGPSQGPQKAVLVVTPGFVGVAGAF